MAVQYDRVRLTWTDNASDEVAFDVERAVDAGPFQPLVRLSTNTTTHEDTTVAPLTSYTYRVFALGVQATSGPSNEASVRTPEQPLSFVLSSEDTFVYRVGIGPVTPAHLLFQLPVANTCSLTGTDGRFLFGLSPGTTRVLRLDLEARTGTTTGFLDQAIDPDRQGLAFSSAGVLYGVFGMELRTIDTSNWSTTTVVTLSGASRVEALVFDRSGRLLASGSDGDDASAEALYSVDLASGALTRIGFYGVPDIDDLTIGEDGLLYGVDGQSSTSLLYRVDLVSGAASQVNDTGVRNARGLAAARFASPRTNGFARVLDLDRNARLGAGDALIVPFDQGVNATGNDPGALSLLVDGDGFGTGATLSAGPAANEVTVALGAGARIRSRGAASPAGTRGGSPSGVDATSGAQLPIVSSSTGTPAAGSTMIDVAPGFVFVGVLGRGHSRCTALGDLDSDGDLDLVVGDDGGPNRIWLNSGTPVGLIESPQQLGNDFTLALALGDIDRDGDLDLVFGNNQQADTVWLNDGAAQFTQSPIALAPLETTLCVLLDDLDRDGDLDLVTGSRTAVHVHSGDGQGGFVETQTLATSAVAIAAVDVDRDGDLDLVHVDLAGIARVHANGGAGTFVDTGARLGSGNPHTLCLADFDRDGDPDLVVGYEGSPDPIWLNDGTGTFVASGRTLASDTTWRLVACDVDADGSQDIVEACGDPSSFSRVWLNDGQGRFVRAQDLGPGNSLDAAVGDIDRDGDLDLVLAEGSTGVQGRITLWHGSLSGTWGQPRVRETGQLLGPFHTTHGVYEDFDRDGDPDAVLGAGSHARLLQGSGLHLRNDGAGGLTTAQTFPPSETHELVRVDFDRDGDQDLFRSATVSGVREVRWLVNDGLGTLTEGPLVNPPGSARNIRRAEFGDLDRDGHLDLVVTFIGTGAPEIYMNDRAGGFTLVRTLAVAARRLMLLDMNGDSWLDLVAIEPQTSQVAVYLNRRDGTFLAANRYSAPSSYEEAADVDRDGDVDLITLNFMSQQVYLNDGSGNLSPGASLISPVAYTLALSDLDADGDVDYVVQHDFDLRFHWNDGAGGFATETSFVPANGLGHPALVDLDRDGDLDIYLQRAGGNRPIGPTDTILLND